MQCVAVLFFEVLSHDSCRAIFVHGDGCQLNETVYPGAYRMIGVESDDEINEQKSSTYTNDRDIQPMLVL